MLCLLQRYTEIQYIAVFVLNNCQLTAMSSPFFKITIYHDLPEELVQSLVAIGG